MFSLPALNSDLLTSIKNKSLDEIAMHNLTEIETCLENKQRFRIRTVAFGTRKVSVVFAATSFFDKLMSYLPSSSDVVNRFVQLTAGVISGRRENKDERKQLLKLLAEDQTSKLFPYAKKILEITKISSNEIIDLVQVLDQKPSTLTLKDRNQSVGKIKQFSVDIKNPVVSNWYNNFVLEDDRKLRVRCGKENSEGQYLEDQYLEDQCLDEQEPGQDISSVKDDYVLKINQTDISDFNSPVGKNELTLTSPVSDEAMLKQCGSMLEKRTGSNYNFWTLKNSQTPTAIELQNITATKKGNEFSLSAWIPPYSNMERTKYSF